jgi:hypothetical protein
MILDQFNSLFATLNFDFLSYGAMEMSFKFMYAIGTIGTLWSNKKVRDFNNKFTS